jgi:Tol biopolymer transport system component
MGEVYEARDTRLGRVVAIKVLRPEVAASAEHRARFLREARSISALDHPHVCTLHDVGREGDVDFLVMRLVDGEPLSRRLKAGPLPVAELLRYAIEIADAVAAAHRRGIVHRDLKPGNVMLSKGGAVVLDFGLAGLRTVAAADGEEAETMTRGPDVTAAGAVLGTPAYMAPEQAQGRAPDPRSDVYSFGVLVYEMATGRRPVAPGAGDGLNPLVTPTLARAIDRALAREPDERWQTMVDLREELKWAAEEPSRGPAGSARSGRGRALAALGVVALAAAAFAAGIFAGRRLTSPAAETASLVRFALPLGEGVSLDVFSSASVAISPDGSRIAYVASQGPERAIYVRALDSSESRRVPGTERASDPTFSPDGRSIAFEAAGKLKRVSLDGGDPRPLVNLAYIAGASWGRDGSIVYTPAFTGGLFAIAAEGGRPRRLTTPERNVAHLWPEVLPDGKAVLFTVWPGGSYDQARVAILSLATGQSKTLVEQAFYGRFCAPDHLLFLRGGTLFAARFDPGSREMTGPAYPVVDDVLHDSFEGAGQFAVSRNGTMVYAAGASLSPLRRLVWVDRGGRRTPITPSPGSYSSPRVSPDGSRIALFQGDLSLSLWVYSLGQGTMTRISFGSDDHDVAWSPDGQRVAFESGRDGIHQVYVRPADGSGEDRQVTSGPYDHYICDWSRDGRTLAYVEVNPETGADLWTADVSGDRPARPILVSPFWEKQATFSPDGRWVAYTSDESGRSEVYVRPFPGPGPRVPISSGEGEEPAWSITGRELFYRSGGRMLAVGVGETPTFTAGRPKPLFQGLYHYSKLPARTYDVAADGRFVMVTGPEPDESTRLLNVALHWSPRPHRPPER